LNGNPLGWRPIIPAYIIGIIAIVVVSMIFPNQRKHSVIATKEERG
jgi:hypothetical protein